MTEGRDWYSGTDKQTLSAQLIAPLSFLSHLIEIISLYCLAEEVTFQPITLETLRSEKAFKKTGQKQQKDLDALRKKHLKEKLVIQKAQCTTIEKAIKGRR